MSDRPIPDDVMKAAQFATIEAIHEHGCRATGAHARATLVIARALMAERERCASIATSRSPFGHNHGELIYLDGPAIAAAIRGEG